MKLQVSTGHVDFLTDDERLAGRYTFINEFKPSLHPVNTPAGHTVTLSMPHDHRHHRGIMYALSAGDVNFWEERPVRAGELVGIEKHQAFRKVEHSGDVVGFEETLMWMAQDGSLPTFHETRSLSCRSAAGGRAFQWTWRTRLEVLRNVELIMSHWAHTRSDGGKVNYHGLGIRFRREFGGVSRGTTLYVDARETPFEEALGSIPREVTFVGTLDGCASPPTAGLTVRQRQSFALFAMKDPFALMCLGPSNAAPLSARAGDDINSEYEFAVFDPG